MVDTKIHSTYHNGASSFSPCRIIIRQVCSGLTISRFSSSTKYGIIGDRTTLVREVEGRELYNANIPLVEKSFGPGVAEAGSRIEISLRPGALIPHLND